MAYDEAAAERVRAALGRKRGLAEKKMMGGLVFMKDDAICCGVSGAALLVRVGKEGYDAALKKAHVRPLEFGGRRPSGFVLVDPPGWKTKAQLDKWIAQGIAVAARA
jgi:hypothetical protein